MRSDTERMTNAPLHVMTVDGKKLCTRVRAIGPALEWSGEAQALFTRLVEAQGHEPVSERPAAVRAVYEAIFAHVCAYNDEWDAETIMSGASTEQMVDAFYLLWQVTDPLAVSQRNEAELLGKRLPQFRGLK